MPGHWEGDLLSGSRNSYIVTLVERHTRYVMLAKIPSRDTQTVVNGTHQAGQEAARPTVQVADVGSGQGTHGPQALHHGDRHRRCTSAIRRALGSAAPTRTPTDCCDSTSPRARICRRTVRLG